MLFDVNYESFSKNPIYGEVAEEVGTLVYYAPIEKDWRRQVYIALIHSGPALSRTGRHKMHGLKDLPYAYLVLATLHDYFNPLKPIITSELQKLQRKDFHIGIEPLFCKMCLREIRNDLMQRGLLPTSLPDVKGQLSRQANSGEVNLEKTKSKKSRISLKEANIRAREIFEKEPNPDNIKVRDLAKKIPCSTGLVPKLPVWKAVQERKKQEKPKKSRKVRLTDKMLKVTGTGKKDQSRLIAQQKEDMQEDERQAKLFLSHKKKLLTRD